jgi:hypothetical protein
LLKIQGDVGGRALFNSFPIANLEWGNPNDFFDIDTPGDYQKLFESENENNPNEI